MKKTIYIFMGLLFSITAYTQQLQIPNSNFENWENSGTATEEPIHWNSLKTADNLASLAPKVLFQDAGRSGNYGIKLVVSDEVFGIQANGIITTGRVHADMNPENGYVYTDVNDAQWNVPFTYRPDSIIGWYKYAPSTGDRGSIEVVLHTGTHAQLPADQTTLDNEVGRAKMWIESAKSNWTRFSIPFEYYKTGQPDYLLAVFTSGDSTASISGSTLWLDDIQLVYNDSTAHVTENPLSETTVFYAQGNLHFRMNSYQHASYKVYNLSGKLIQQDKVEPTVKFLNNKGFYFITIEQNNHQITKKIVVQ